MILFHLAIKWYKDKLSIIYMSDILNKLVEALVKHKMYGCCISASILLHELLPNSTLLNGFLNIYNKFSAWHVWVESDGLILDVGTLISSKCFNVKLLTSHSDKPLYKRNDLDTLEEIKINKQNELIFELYQNSPSQFWHLLSLVEPEKYNILINIYNSLSNKDNKTCFNKQKVNESCNCKSGKKIKKCCKLVYDRFNNV